MFRVFDATCPIPSGGKSWFHLAATAAFHEHVTAEKTVSVNEPEVGEKIQSAGLGTWHPEESLVRLHLHEGWHLELMALLRTGVYKDPAKPREKVN